MCADTFDPFRVPADELSFENIRDWVLDLERAAGIAESLTLELKRERTGSGIVDAVVAFANSDGGVVLVGVDERGSGEERFVGVAPTERDALALQLRNALPSDAMPELVPVAIPAPSDRIILVVRVDADRAIQPVIAGGRIRIRMPGANTPARREDVVTLVDRGRSSAGATHRASVRAPMELARLVLLADVPGPFVDIRLQTASILAPSVLARPWFDTATRKAAVEAMGDSPLPDRLFESQRRRHDGGDRMWQLEAAHSTRLRLTPVGGGASAGPASQDVLTILVEVELEARLLRSTVAVRIEPTGSPHHPLKLSISDLYELLFACAVSSASLLEAVAFGMGAGYLRSADAVSASLSGSSPVQEVLAIPDGYQGQAPVNNLERYGFGPAETTSSDRAHANLLVREWVALMLYDLGLDEFEDDLAGMHQPRWNAESRAQE